MEIARMPFPTEDQAWNDTLLYLLERRRPGERTLAPDEFADELPFVRPYSQHDAQEPPAYAWVVVHKGLTGALGAPFLHRLPDWSMPVYANDVFVVFAREPGVATADLSDTDHVKSLFASLPADAGIPMPPPAPVVSLPVAVAPPLPLPAEPEPAPPSPPPAAAPLAREADGLDRLRQQEVLRLLREHVGDRTGQRVLDLGAGRGRFATVFSEAQVLGIEADAEAVEQARAGHAGLPNFRFTAADLTAPLREPPFDATLLIDSLPEDEDAAAGLLAAAAAATRSGGLLFVSADNSDALGRRAPGGVTLAALTAWVRAAGFRPLRAEGVVLPWGAPADDSLLDALRELGRLAGPAYAQGIVLVARRG
jgi:SAM-dependent methyltransferase